MSRLFSALTERERETLRLLVEGHDAKSIARHLGLSVHTINERLRDARRKLGVTSSREAARLLADVERDGPQFRTDKNLGVSTAAPDPPPARDADGHAGRPVSLVWFSGGMLIMSLVIATIVGFAVLQGSGAATAPLANGRASAPAPAIVGSGPVHAASLPAARSWLALVDGQRWAQSWRVASAFFRSKIPAEQWASTIQSVRQPLGPVSSRTFLTMTSAGVLPGAPSGQYEIIQFQTSFADKRQAVETVTLVREDGTWKPVGYFIR